MNCYSVRIEQGVSFRVEDQAGPARLSSLARASRLYKTSHWFMEWCPAFEISYFWSKPETHFRRLAREQSESASSSWSFGSVVTEAFGKKKKSFWYLFSLECFCAEPPHKSRLSVHRPTLCWEKRGLEIRASSLFYRLLGTVGVPRPAYPDVDDTKADADRTPAQRREREVAPRTTRRRKRPASRSQEENTGPPFAQRRANACISPL